MKKIHGFGDLRENQILVDKNSGERFKIRHTEQVAGEVLIYLSQIGKGGSFPVLFGELQSTYRIEEK